MPKKKAMKKVLGLDKWKIVKKIPAKDRRVVVKIYTRYPDYKKLIHLDPKDRQSQISDHLVQSLKRLTAIKTIEKFEIIGPTTKPRGIELETTFSNLKKLDGAAFISNIFIEKIEGAIKIKESKKNYYFCVKAIFQIQVEGKLKGIQSYEERYILIKATSAERAEKTLLKSFRRYETPYLNSNGELVRWKFEKFDDWYGTDIEKPSDVDRQYGVEVFSKLRTRKLMKENRWLVK